MARIIIIAITLALASLTFIGCGYEDTEPQPAGPRHPQEEPAYAPQCPQHRQWTLQKVYYENVAVEHPWLYGRDTYIENNYGYDHQAYSKNDVASLLLSPIVAIGNIAAMPIIAVIGPHPWETDQSRANMPTEDGVYNFTYSTSYSPIPMSPENNQ